jgi:hypothetical protein
MRSEGRLRRSVRLTRTAWRLLRGDRTMLVLAVAAAALTVAGMVLVFGVGGYLHDPHPSRGRLALVLLISAWPLTFAGTFLNVALAAAAAAALDGRHLDLRAALRVAWTRLGQIAAWSLLAAGVGVLISEIAQRIPGGGRLASWVLGGAWSLVTIFAVPVLALEGCGARRCVTRSATLLRGRWGEGAAGTLGISALTGVAAIVPGILLGAGFAVIPFAPGVGVPLLVLGLAGFAAVVTVGSAVRQIFAVALYRYAAHDVVAGPFGEADLQRPFAPRRGRLWRRGRRS